MLLSPSPDTLTASAAAGTIMSWLTTSVTLTVAGGTTNYAYFWNNGATTQNLSNVGPGTYTVVVTGTKSCTATASVVITACCCCSYRHCNQR
ncbi:MAG: hypothetical protein U0T75_03710 [Chitinophagales bacterium]